MRAPAWISPTHPVIRRELKQWQKHARQLWITFVWIPAGCVAFLWLPYVVFELRHPYAFGVGRAGRADILPGMTLTLWLCEAVLSLWLGVVATTRAVSLVAHERETRNWPLLRLTLLDSAGIAGAKIGAVLYWLRWPLVLVAALRLAAVAVSAAGAGNLSAAELGLASLFAVLFCAELAISFVYNCAVGFLTSSLTRTTALANGLVNLIQAGLFLLVFAPLWYAFAGTFLSAIFYPTASAWNVYRGLTGGVLFFSLVILLQLTLTAVMLIAATSRVERIVD